MSEPEIARRCSHCGASIRVRAFFCPQCGGQLANEQLSARATPLVVQSEPSLLTETLAEGPREEADGDRTPAVEVQQKSRANNRGSTKKQRKRARRIAEAAAQAEELPTLAEKATTPAEKATTLAEKTTPAKKSTTLAEKATTLAEKSTTPVAGVKVPDQDKRLRTTIAPQGLIEDNLLPRVEKLRKVSSVVFDEVAYDPSLRFVLVAALLFVIFLVIVLMSKLVG